MFGSTRVTTIRGIPIRIHFTLFLAFLFLVLQFGAAGIGAGLILFGSVLAHELGHSVVAQKLGIQIASIDLHLLGGAALMTEQPERPADEIMVAAAGPAVSFAIGVVALLGAWAMGGTLSIGAASLANLLAFTGAVNLGMGVFNLVPALPMDGGRIFRALLARRMGALRATRIAANVARGFSVLFGVVALFTGSWSLALIGAFVYMLAGREQRYAEAKDAWGQVQAPRLGRWFDHLPSASEAPTVIDVDQSRPAPSFDGRPLRFVVVMRDP